MSTAVALPRPGAVASRFRFVTYELALWLALYPVYLAIRGLSIDSYGTALANARDLISVERSLSIFHEGAVQDALSALHGPLSTYYMLGFGPVVAATLVWLATTWPELYRWLRTALLVSLGFAAVSYALLPMAPPRLVPDIGIADTVGLSGGHDTGSFGGVVPFNPYAAMPSMHVGWSLLVGIFGFRGLSRSPATPRAAVDASPDRHPNPRKYFRTPFGFVRRPARSTAPLVGPDRPGQTPRALRGRAWRWVFAAHPVVMAVAVTATGNHYFLDSAAGVAVVLTALAAIWLFNRKER